MAYTEAEARNILKDISEYIHFQTAEAIGASTIASVFSSQIPVGMERNVWEIIASSEDGSEQNLAIYAGNGPGAYETTQYFRQRVPDITNAPPLRLGGDPLKPIKIIDAVAVVNVVDLLAAVHETNAINLEISYYDTPIRIRN